MPPDPSEDELSGQEAPLLPAPVSDPHAGPGRAHKPSTSSSDAAGYKMPRSTGRFSAMLQIGLGILVLVLLWAWWPSTGFGSPTREDSERELCRTADPAWPTSIGYEGPTPTGSEALAAQTAYPGYSDTSPLSPPSSLLGQSQLRTQSANSTEFNILHKLGNLSPWRSVSHGLGDDAQIPDGCEVEQVQLLHRHGARYPTLNAGPAEFAAKLKAARGFKATGSLAFLEDFEYKLGAEILTPFGRNQLFSLGASFRVKYGHLLDKHPGVKPVFRTESQDRMLKSALNFAAGFFGIPFESQYHQLITVEWPKYNNTLAPYMTCDNANSPDLTDGAKITQEWLDVYLTAARNRFQEELEGLTLNTADVWSMQAMCAYEIVALGGSTFCELFTEEEWEGFDYYTDLQFWYMFSFGQPAQAALGLGWVQEWLSRVTDTRLTTFDSTTNASYHTPEYFPLQDKQSIFVDATHDTVISAVITTLGFKSLTATGPPPSTYIPKDRSFVTSHISPFSANLHSQIVSCPASGSSSSSSGQRTKWVRWVLNDGPVPLDHIPACKTGNHLEQVGFCELGPYVEELQKATNAISWDYDCLGDYSLGKEPIMDGRPLKQ